MNIIYRMFRSSLWGLLLLLFLCCCNGHPAPSATIPHADSTPAAPPPQPVAQSPYHVDTVLIANMKFEPQQISVHKGDTIVWVNTDMVAHCVTETKTQAWTSMQLDPGQLWKMPVTKSADYFCNIHKVMHGKIIVVGQETAKRK